MYHTQERASSSQFQGSRCSSQSLVRRRSMVTTTVQPSTFNPSHGAIFNYSHGDITARGASWFLNSHIGVPTRSASLRSGALMPTQGYFTCGRVVGSRSCRLDAKQGFETEAGSFEGESVNCQWHSASITDCRSTSPIKLRRWSRFAADITVTRTTTR